MNMYKILHIPTGKCIFDYEPNRCTPSLKQFKTKYQATVYLKRCGSIKLRILELSGFIMLTKIISCGHKDFHLYEFEVIEHV